MPTEVKIDECESCGYEYQVAEYWVKLPRELRDAVVAYGNAMYDLGAAKITGRNELALIEKSSITRDALAAKLLPHHQESVK